MRVRLPQVHIALTGTVTETVAMWASGDDGGHVVQWGTSPVMMDMWAQAKSSTYTTADLCDAPANTTDAWYGPGAVFCTTAAQQPLVTRGSEGRVIRS